MTETQQIRDIISAYRTTYTRRSFAQRSPTRAERDVLDLCMIAEAMADAIDALGGGASKTQKDDIRSILLDICQRYVTPSIVFGPIKTEDVR